MQYIYHIIKIIISLCLDALLYPASLKRTVFYRMSPFTECSTCRQLSQLTLASYRNSMWHISESVKSFYAICKWRYHFNQHSLQLHEPVAVNNSFKLLFLFFCLCVIFVQTCFSRTFDTQNNSSNELCKSLSAFTSIISNSHNL